MRRLIDLEEATAFERLALEAATPLAGMLTGTLDLRTRPGNTTIFVGAIEGCAEVLERCNLVHRRAEVTAGELRILDRQQPSQLRILSAEEQLAVCRVARRLIDGILAQSLTTREHDDLTFQLVQLGRLTGLRKRGGNQPKKL